MICITVWGVICPGVEDSCFVFLFDNEVFLVRGFGRWVEPGNLFSDFPGSGVLVMHSLFLKHNSLLEYNVFDSNGRLCTPA